MAPNEVKFPVLIGNASFCAPVDVPAAVNENGSENACGCPNAGLPSVVVALSTTPFPLLIVMR